MKTRKSFLLSCAGFLVIAALVSGCSKQKNPTTSNLSLILVNENTNESLLVNADIIQNPETSNINVALVNTNSSPSNKTPTTNVNSTKSPTKTNTNTNKNKNSNTNTSTEPVTQPPIDNPKPTASLTTTPICPGFDPVTLSWSTTNAATITLESFESSNQPKQPIDIGNRSSGSTSVSATKATFYLLTAINSNNDKVTKQIRVDRPALDANYPVITGYSDNQGNSSHSSRYNSYSCGGSGTNILHIGDSVTLSATAYDPNGDPLEYRFTSLFQSSTSQDWSGNSSYTWTVGSNDVGASKCIIIDVRDNDGYNRLGAYDDNTPACYDVAHP